MSTRKIGNFLELWRDIAGLEEVLMRELPLKDRNREALKKFSDQWMEISVHPLRNDFLDEQPRSIGEDLVEFHLVFRYRHRSGLRDRVFSIYPNVSTISVRKVMRAWEQASDSTPTFVPGLYWKHLFRIIRKKDGKLFVFVYNLD